jgi:RimJ/RimL family protein N-acetyltransferase
VIETPRLILRPWRDADIPIFVDIGRDPDVMRYFPNLLTPEGTAEGVGRIRGHFEREGWGLFAVEIKGGPEFVGFCGIQRVPFEAAFTPAVEIGWRIARTAWGHGYATEGARACLDFARDTLHLDEVVAMVVPDNARSIAVMERLGMSYVEGGDFDHPRIPEGQISVGGFPARRHRLYHVRP